MSKTNDLRALVTQVDKDNPPAGAVKALKKYLAENPDVWRITGDLAQQANLIMIDKMDAPAGVKQAMEFGLSAIEKELARPDDGPLEALIIRQIVGCWLRLSYVEYTLGRNTVEGNFSMAQGAYWEKRVSAAQRRYLRAIETLARVRRMQLPAVQVNIAAQQVNQVR